MASIRRPCRGRKRFGVSVGRMNSKMKPRSRRGGGRPTIADVAKLAGVGAITVSRALREPGLVSEDLRRQIAAAVKTLGYVPDTNARALASARANVVGVLVPSLTNNVFADVVRGIYDGLSDTDFQIQIGNTHYSGTGRGTPAQSVPRPAACRADRFRHRPDPGRPRGCWRAPAARSCRSWKPRPIRST